MYIYADSSSTSFIEQLVLLTDCASHKYNIAALVLHHLQPLLTARSLRCAISPIFESTMEPSSSQSQQVGEIHQPQSPSSQYACRVDIRRAIERIVRRSLLQRLAQRQLEYYGWNRPPHVVTRLSKADRCRAIRQSRLIEDILYKRADTMADYQDLSTLEERVYKAGRAVYISAQRQEMERESERRVAVAAALSYARANLPRQQQQQQMPMPRQVGMQFSDSFRGGNNRPRRRMSF